MRKVVAVTDGLQLDNGPLLTIQSMTHDSWCPNVCKSHGAMGGKAMGGKALPLLVMTHLALHRKVMNEYPLPATFQRLSHVTECMPQELVASFPCSLLALRDATWQSVQLDMVMRDHALSKNGNCRPELRGQSSQSKAAMA